MGNGGADTDDSTPAVDLLVGGAVGLRLLDATDAEVRAVERQLGVVRAPTPVEPDVVVRYVDDLEPAGPLTQTDLGRFGSADGRFWLLRGLGGRRVRVVLDPADLGQPLHVTAERKGRALPLLTQLLGVVAAGKGAVAVHASAFRYRGRGVLVAGWSDSGKTETLLAALADGAEFVGDDTVYLDAASGRLTGLATAVRLKAWHLRAVPEVRSRLSRRDRARLAPSAASERLAELETVGPGTTRRRRIERKAAELLGDAMTVWVPPEDVTGGPVTDPTATLDHVVLVTASSTSDVTVTRADPGAVARRVQLSLQEERANLLAAYRQLRFAFPDAGCPSIDEVDARETALLEQAFGGAAVWRLDHPHPVDLGRLTPALRTIVAAGP